jgi:ubiquinone/menaquinone biosynthesis C-methylase UbiE
MAYVLENIEEANRLRYQQGINAYNIAEEFESLRINDKSIVLDAGCGEGALTRYFLDQNTKARIEGVDFSEVRVMQAAKSINNHRATFFQSSLESIQKEDSYYDYIACRYVYEHLQNPQAVSSELYRVSKKGATVCICDFDNIFTGFHTTNHKFNQTLSVLQNKLGIDFNVGRKIPAFLTQSGFTVKDVKLSTHLLTGKQLEMEKENYIKRFNQMSDVFKVALGGTTESKRFFNTFIDMMDSAGSVFYMNKFVVTAIK